uniref:Putative Ribonuclease BN n=1 Tax=mine drainage metagenome TaxID=410659 RepID=E6QQU0_9ZZZZ
MAILQRFQYTDPMRKYFNQFIKFALVVANRFMADGSSQTAASLTYTSLLALVPLLTLGLAVVSAFPAFAEASLSFKSFLLQNMMPDTASKVINVYMLQFSQNAGKLTLIGTSALIVTALLLVQNIEDALNSIWHVCRKRPWTQRFLIYWVLLTLGPMLIAVSLYTTTYLVRFAMGLSGDIGTFHLLMLSLAPLILTVTALSVLYFTVPNRYVPAGHAWLGGLLGGLCLEGMKLVFSHYISFFSSYTVVYGAFSALPLFLIWIYLSWMAVLLGATLTATLPYYHQPRLANIRTPGSAFYTALSVLEHLTKAQRMGEVLTVRQLAAASSSNWDELEYVLVALNEKHWILRSGKGWALAMHPDRIRLREIFEHLVFHPNETQYALAELVDTPQQTLSAWLGRNNDENVSLTG